MKNASFFAHEPAFAPAENGHCVAVAIRIDDLEELPIFTDAIENGWTQLNHRAVRARMKREAAQSNIRSLRAWMLAFAAQLWAWPRFAPL